MGELRTQFAAAVQSLDAEVRSQRPAVLRANDLCPSDEVVGGFFFDFEAIRTESSDRDAPRRSRS